MNTLMVSCRTLEKEIGSIMEKTGIRHPVRYLPYELHASPERMKITLQKLIDSLEGVDRVLLCVSGCGNSTKGLKATTAELVVPKTSDCLDILLSDRAVSEIDRDPHGIFITESWMGFFQNSALDFDTLTEKYGREEAETRLKTVYRGYTDFYLIQTGMFDPEPVKAYIMPVIELLGATLHVVEGKCGVLTKLITGKMDDDFYVVPKGGCL